MNHKPIHEKRHPLAGATVRLKSSKDEETSQKEYVIEDWWDRVYGDSWRWARGNPAALKYAMHLLAVNAPNDNEAVYGKIGAFGYIVHVSELGEIIK